jgi:hypothetical protein
MRLNLTGQRYGRLTVLYRTRNVRHGQYDVVCRCKCGTITTVALNHLRLSRTVSCGCYRMEQARKASPKGEAHGAAKLTEADIQEIFNRRTQGMLQREIAAEYGVARTTIAAILQRRNWRHLHR